SSCEGFLDMAPTNQADSSTCLTSTHDAEVMLTGLIYNLTAASYYGRNFLLYGDAKGGDLTIYTGGNPGDALYYFNHSASNNSYSGYWSQGYFCLLQANNIIANIKALQAEGTTENFDDYLGQALTIRAMIHFDLVRLYGKPFNMDRTSDGIPVVTEPVDAAAKLLRDPVEKAYTQIVADLTEAAPLLSSSVKRGYFNYYANQMLLGKVYQYMDNQSAALTCFENVINSKKYTLYTPANWVASWSREFGSESILELAIYPSERDLGTGSLGCYYMRKGHINAANGNFYASKYWMDIMGENDVRWGIMDWDHYYNDSSVSDNIRARSHYGKDCCYKYSGSTGLAGDKGSSNFTAVNIKVFRLSEAYLAAAEAALATGAGAKAADYLNAIAQRNPDYTPFTASSVKIDDIYDEFRREFLCEGKLFFEACRLNKTVTFEDNAYYGSTVSSRRGLTIDRNNNLCRLPISIDEIHTNPDIQQNPGYSGSE
ncbi:MAG: RagB/SusD family nutrient uptake outer membrane protein, partial [Bacteroidales bacterium]|nr:RagB/SusD family nutrient uptake outer membrane protein [Bacteroidales bacterium]